MDQHQQDIIRAHPLGTHLGPARTSLIAIVKESTGLNSASRQVLQSLALVVLPALQSHDASCYLPSPTDQGSLRDDILRLISAVASGVVHLDLIKPLLSAVLADPRQSDVDVWKQVYHAVAAAESTPSRKPTSSFLHTPLVFRTSSFVNSSERRDYMDRVLQDELGVMYVDVPNFYETFFGEIPDLDAASEDVFQKCTAEAGPLFCEDEGWTGWPETVNESAVLTWLSDLVERLVQWIQGYKPTARRLLARPNTPLDGLVAKRKLDVGFLKKNLSDDALIKARLDLARYVKEFDRLGGIASTKFDIHQEGRLLVSTILGFLWMSNDRFGLDPTIIERHGKIERLIIDQFVRGAQGIVGRGTTCWRAHVDGGDGSSSFVIKDSWQYLERDEEGELLQTATAKGVTNLARHYYHETVQVRGEDDNIQSSIRKGLDISKASNYREARLTLASPQSRASSTGSKRSASQIGASLPSGKRSRSGSVSPTKFERQPPPNRIHRRIVLCDYGMPIYKASSRVALLKAFDECVQGHESLFKAGFLHRDISINNLLINESPSRSSFLIDLDLAIKTNRLQASGAREKTGTRAFMAIGVLVGDDHSFMDDLESFFWVLFWICIHYDKHGQGRTDVGDFGEWNFANTKKLARQKLGTVSKKSYFHDTISEYFTSYYQPLVPWVLKLRDVVFPNGGNWEQEDRSLYVRMRQLLRDAQNDPLVAELDS
ncbi:hypothetical protein GGR57DRAFT_490407 [Xylariaceae sp. FL1272]|nr:hypothetical protein GGR57DRAFT_490407 [Xylariaceae sp. FL1272]